MTPIKQHHRPEQSSLFVGGFDLLSAILGTTPAQRAHEPSNPSAEAFSPGLTESVESQFTTDDEDVIACAATFPMSGEAAPTDPEVESSAQPTEEAPEVVPYQGARITARTVAPWPPLDAEKLEALHGGAVARYDANIAAIELLRKLEQTGSAPSDSERLTLAGYSGWGGVKEPFEPRCLDAWKPRAAALQQLLSTEEWESARKSVVDAFFTDARIAEAMWAACQHLGFTGGRVLEPSAGAGVFLGTMPSELAMRSDIHAVELDDLSGRLLRTLYGHEARVRITGFEACSYPDDWFDLVIGNVPFGQYRVGCTRNRPYSRESVHNYFIGRALDIVRPGGVVAVITSTSFLDSEREAFRDYIHHRARLIGAVRLPVGTFGASAGTSVSADIVFLQKRHKGEAAEPGEWPWVKRQVLPPSVVPAGCADYYATKSGYWHAVPSMVLGTWSLKRSQYGGQDLVAVYEGNRLHDDLRERLKTLPANIVTDCSVQTERQSLGDGFSDAQAWRSGQLLERHGTIVTWQDGGWTSAGLSGKAADRALGMIRVRDLARKLLERQVSPEATDEELRDLRQDLNLVYDAFVRKHGAINLKQNVRVFRRDPDFPLLLSLEIFDNKTQTAEKAAIFTTRTGGPSTAPIRADSVADALTISMAEVGEVNPAYLGQLLGKTPDEAIDAALAEGLIFINPISNRYETAGAYLSGNVREKLQQAQIAGPSFEPNVVALTAALPRDLEPGDIDARLGAPWIPASDYEEFFKHLIASEARGTTVRVDREPNTGTWSLFSSMTHGVAMTQTWGTSQKNAAELMNASLNGKLATVYQDLLIDGREVTVTDVPETAAAREKQSKIEAEFQDWLWRDTARASRLARLYNDRFNNYVDRVYDGSKLRLPGYSFSLIPDSNQRSSVARIATGANTLLAQVVGAGKSLTMILGSMELKRLGLAKKPLHAIPNHMLRQYTAEFVRAYPRAKVLMASKDDLGKGPTRRLFCAKVATGDWDAIIMTHSAFERIAPDPKLAEQLIEETLSEVRSAKEAIGHDRTQRSIVKALVRTEKDWEARLERLQANWKKDDFITLRQMGVDRLFVDELHLFKNLFRFSQMERVAGLPNSNAQRSTDLLIKTKEIMAMHGGRECGLVGATGTPVSNTMAELHVMQRYLQPVSLQQAGIDSFDAWAANFGRVVTGLEVSPDGSSFRMNSRFAQFVNLPELMGLFRQVADIKTKEMLQLPTPGIRGGGPQTCLVQPSPQLKAYVAELVKRADAIKNRQVKPDQDNMLAVTNDGRKAALDLRLVHPGFEPDDTGKLAACAAKVRDIWEQTESFRGTQIIFCDLGTPSSKRFSVYQDLKRRLMQLGVPATEIAFIHDASTDAAKEALFAQMREGTVRVMIASTAKAGIGTNVQTRLYTVHHLDVPWRPADIEQRNGRAERRGNTCEFIEIWLYVTEGSFDAYSWQLVAAKAKFIAQVMAGDRSIRKIDDVGMQALSYEEVKAIACGNPAVKEKALLDAEIRRLELVRSSFLNSRWQARNALQRLPRRREEQKRVVEWLEAKVAKIETTGDVLEIEGKAFAAPSDIQELLEGISTYERSISHIGLGERTVAHYAGLPVCIMPSRPVDRMDFKVILDDYLRLEVHPYVNGDRFHEAMQQALACIREKLDGAKADLKYLDYQEPQLQAQACGEFEHETRLQELRQRSTQLEVELGLMKNADGTEAMDEKSTLANKSTVTAEDAGQLADETDPEQTQEEVDETA